MLPSLPDTHHRGVIDTVRNRPGHSRPILSSPVLAVFLAVLGALQLGLAIRVILRLAGSANRVNIKPAASTPAVDGTVTVLVPVLNEAGRLGPCLDGLSAQGPELATILVIDGGSIDGTMALAKVHAQRDPRIQVIDASPVPGDWNGKAWNLQHGLTQGDVTTPWVLTVDADVRPRPGLVQALLAHAETSDVAVLSGATRQRLSGAAEGLVHPALLTTLVYRYGIPGGTTTVPDEVQANGQCMLIRREALAEIGGFAEGQHSLCEDVTIARRLAIAGHRVGFAETGDLVDVAMYASAGEAWRNWPRSLTMRDQFGGHAVPFRLAEVALIQGLPLVISVGGLLRQRRHRFPNTDGLLAQNRVVGQIPALAFLVGLNRVLLLLRVGVLAGMVRAYDHPPITYWLSPLLDLPVALRLIQSALRRTHTWRGRSITRS